MIAFKKKVQIWGLYMLFGPLIFYAAYQLTTDPLSFLTVDYLLFMILGIIVAVFPTQTEGSIFFLITGVSLATLVLFGLFAELLLTTVTLIALMIKANIKRDEHYRYPMNLMMFQLMSLAAAGSYHLVNTVLNTSQSLTLNITALFVYMIVHLLTNQALLKGVYRVFFNETIPFFDKHFTFSFNSSMLLVSLTFVLIYLYQSLESVGVVIGSLPFITLTVGINVYFNHKMHNDYLKKVNTHARHLSELKVRQDVVHTYIRQLTAIFPVDTVSYYTHQADQSLLKTHLYEKKNGMKELRQAIRLSEESVLYKAVTDRSIQSYNRASDWKPYCLQEIEYLAESALVLPVEQNNQLVGVMLLSHRTKNMYNEMLISLIELFHKYFGIALDNAHHYETLEEKNETDFLTSLTNLKGFSKQLEESFSVQGGKPISIIVLDLDHFKKTNDTYGHQAGNEVLKQLAALLNAYSNDLVTVARFGGEEFVVLLEEHSKQEAVEIAESIRQKIASSYFIITESIQNKNHIKVKLTASLGVASYPTDSQNVQELIMLADKAMYIGSKQRGRNRVTAANEGSYVNDQLL